MYMFLFISICNFREIKHWVNLPIFEIKIIKGGKENILFGDYLKKWGAFMYLSYTWLKLNHVSEFHYIDSWTKQG